MTISSGTLTAGKYAGKFNGISYIASSHKFTGPIIADTIKSKEGDKMLFQSSYFNFDGGDMYVDGAITCKKRMKVAEVETNKIMTKDVVVEMGHPADYVFEDDYQLRSLQSVKDYVKENKHLPGIPSAMEIEENGMSLSEMTNLLLEKVEELTLHVIRLEEENKALKDEVGELRPLLKENR